MVSRPGHGAVPPQLTSLTAELSSMAWLGSSVDPRVGHFQFGASTNTTDINSHVQVFVDITFFFDKYQEWNVEIMWKM